MKRLLVAAMATTDSLGCHAEWRIFLLKSSDSTNTSLGPLREPDEEEVVTRLWGTARCAKGDVGVEGGEGEFSRREASSVKSWLGFWRSKRQKKLL